MSNQSQLHPDHIRALEEQLAQIKRGEQPQPVPGAAQPMAPSAPYVPPGAPQPPPSGARQQVAAPAPQSLEELGRARFLAFDGNDHRIWYVDPRKVLAVESPPAQSGAPVARLHFDGGHPPLVILGNAEQVAQRLAEQQEAERLCNLNDARELGRAHSQHDSSTEAASNGSKENPS